MGDKTRTAAVALAARYADIVQVVLGTTFGMMLANVPALFLGDKIAKKVSKPLLHGIAATIFAVLGLFIIFNVGKVFLKALCPGLPPLLRQMAVKGHHVNKVHA